jgi:hypothetical protein
LFFEEQQQTRPDKPLAAQSQAHLQIKGPAGVSPPHHWFEVPRPQNGGIVFKFRFQQEQNTT